MTITRMTTKRISFAAVPVVVEDEAAAVIPQRVHVPKTLRRDSMNRRGPSGLQRPSNTARRLGSKPSTCSSTRISNAAVSAAAVVPRVAPKEAAEGDAKGLAAAGGFW